MIRKWARFSSRKTAEELTNNTAAEGLVGVYKKAFIERFLLEMSSVLQEKYPDEPIQLGINGDRLPGLQALSEMPARDKVALRGMLTRTTKDAGKRYYKAIEEMQQFIETLVRIDMMGDSKHVLERTMADADQYLKGEMTAQEYADDMKQRASNISGYRSFSYNALQRPLATEYIYAALLEVPAVMARNNAERYADSKIDPAELQQLAASIAR